ncbi:hypothetical protein F2P44_29485 [Massilia sp. CCM 8695]|uniref:Secreted protein n=1 Tax=Massilia frigida TaxID=2609281 RepID=A0ABX0NIL8_9BURK|nr:hypothetical protein [Massilia frigida]NHZ83374.1 hypothetical protein [Massilia frigida]
MCSITFVSTIISAWGKQVVAGPADLSWRESIRSDGDGPAGVTSPNNIRTGEYDHANEHKRKVYSHPDVITLDKLPRF